MTDEKSEMVEGKVSEDKLWIVEVWNLAGDTEAMDPSKIDKKRDKIVDQMSAKFLAKKTVLWNGAILELFDIKVRPNPNETEAEFIDRLKESMDEINGSPVEMRVRIEELTVYEYGKAKHMEDKGTTSTRGYKIPTRFKNIYE